MVSVADWHDTIYGTCDLANIFCFTDKLVLYLEHFQVFKFVPEVLLPNVLLKPLSLSTYHYDKGYDPATIIQSVSLIEIYKL